MSTQLIDWRLIDTVLIDMDGTLLDLHFDNYFWQEYLPARYAEIKRLDPQQAKRRLNLQMRSIQGTLNWYSTDYWSHTLDLDVIELKREVSHKIATRPYCEAFLDALQYAGKELVMVTNAHQDSLALKMEMNGIAGKFDCLISVHEFNLPKENRDCWKEVHLRHPLNRKRTLLIDDNLKALQSALDYGIGQVLAIYQPDSKAPHLDVKHFPAIVSFEEIMPISG